MPLLSAPWGLKPVRHFHGHSIVPQVIRLTKALAEATPSMGRNSPVALDATGRLASAANAADWIGAFIGVEYVDNATGRPVLSNRWVNGSTVLDRGGDSARFTFTRDPFIIYEIWASAAMLADDLGEEAAFIAGTIASFDATTGISTASLDVATLAATQNMMRVINIGQRIDNDWGDAFPIVEVMIARSQELAAKAGV